MSFNGHPPLGVNATQTVVIFFSKQITGCFNGHPPLGVNATLLEDEWLIDEY